MEFEQLGVFYLGKEYDPHTGTTSGRLVLYDSRDLTTHAVVLGMTGSGKTGLCIDLLEEAAIDRVPALIIDPKGDITNLLLQFPDLQPADFLPWINPDDAARKGMSPEEFAAHQAQLWRRGLAEWGQDGERIRRLGQSADFRIYTPGSETGRPVSLLHSLDPPRLDWSQDVEALRERIEATVSALLGLLGLQADPLRSREHILLSHLMEHFWRQGEPLDLGRLILAIQKPPLSRLGVFDLETFFPSQERFQLALSLNSLLASPSFAAWLQGDPLEIPEFLAAEDGRPRHSIFYIAHLGEPERIFFVTLLLNQLIGWMRTQPGTTSLRAVVYMDEIFGFFPPTANPPCKKPMLTLLKQARAFGVGMVLATQNPVDLDYKGLGNTGTWFIGRLQTERDKERVIDGLLGAAGDTALDRTSLADLISRLGSRVFLLHNVHDTAPLVFQTRWALSYLRGPLTRQQIQRLQPSAPSAAGFRTGREPAAMPSQHLPAAETAGLSDTPPLLPQGVTQIFLPPRPGTEGSVSAGGPLRYRPGLLGYGSIHFLDRKTGVDTQRDFALLWQGLAVQPDLWRQAEPWEGRYPFGATSPPAGARFEDLPAALSRPQELNRLAQELADHLVRTCRLEVLYCPQLQTYSRPDESDREFRLRLNQAAREVRDAEIARMAEQYRKQMEKIEERLRAAELALAHQKEAEKSRQTEFLVSVGETVLGMFLGRRTYRAASSSMSRYRQRTAAEQAVEKAEARVESLRQDLAALQDELRRKTEEVTSRWQQAGQELQTVAVRPARSGVRVQGVAVAWIPV
ncbi:MAG: DUF87 domain-containing protein [Acidobacteriota bacterium]